MAGTPIAVFAPAVWVTVTVEPDVEGGDEIHLHAGGQGIWIARLLRQLGQEPIVCAPVGGESGRAFRGLTVDWDIPLRAVPVRASSPVTVTDRRGGQRQELARSRPPRLERHELDELYDLALEAALEAGTCVVTGQHLEPTLPPEDYRRLAADLRAGGVRVVGDLHGDELAAFLEGGPLDVLKVSDGDLVADGIIERGDRTEEGALAATRQLVEAGAAAVVLSRSGNPVLARFADGGVRRVSGPELATVDTTGSGDSMTAALAAAVATGQDVSTMLARAWAAGAANVTRHGSGGASAGLVDELAARVTIEDVADVRDA